MFTPDDYAKNTPTLNRVNMTYVPKLINAMTWDFSGGNVLDYGCGPGVLGHNLILPKVLDTNSTMYSTDISAKMIEYACRELPHPNVVYATGYLPDSFPFPNMLFDKIFSINVFHFIADIDATLSSMVDILKPGGQLGFTTTTVNFPVIQTLSMLATSSKWAEHLSDCQNYVPIWTDYKDTPPEQHFRNIFVKKTGLKEVSLNYINTKVMATTEALVDICMTMNPCLHKVPEPMHMELREEYGNIMKSLLQISSNPEELIVPVELVYGVLVKL